MILTYANVPRIVLSALQVLTYLSGHYEIDIIIICIL